MKQFYTLGDLYISDFVKEEEAKNGIKHSLSLQFDEDGAVRLSEHVPINRLFGKYWYRSGTNESMKMALKDIVDSILSLRKGVDSYIYGQNTWIDIASNDGTLLGFVPSEYYRIGIDPCEDSFLEEARKNSEKIIQDYFSKEALGDYRAKANVITSIAMFYDVVDREKFLHDIYEVLDNNGLWVLQLSYTPLMLKQLAFDNICHEHYYYYSLQNIKKLFERHGFRIMDVCLNSVNGGSFRLYVVKDKFDETLYGDQAYRDVCTMRINSLLAYEEHVVVPDDVITWYNFFEDVERLGSSLRLFLTMAREKGKKVWGYGASTKGNTLLQYFNIDNTMIGAIADRSEYKWGLRTIGTDIPIVSEEEMRRVHPDYLVILPWHFASEFVERENAYLCTGGKFIIPCPKLRVIRKSENEIRSFIYTNTFQETSAEIESYINKCIND